MIEKIIAHSRTSEIDAVCSRIISAYISSSIPRDSYLSSIIDQLKPISNSLNETIKKIKIESDLEEKDQIRDDSVRSFYYLTNGYTYHPDKEINSAAQKLVNIFSVYGLEIITKSYSIETSLVNSLIKELSKPELVQASARLSGVTEIIDTIKLAQDNFESSYLQFEKEKALIVDEDSATTIKKSAVQIINGPLIAYLNGMLSVDRTTYGQFAQVINQVISDNNINVKKRSKSASATETVAE